MSITSSTEGTASHSTWSPADYPELVFAWSVVPGGPLGEPSFATTVSLASASATAGPNDPQSRLLDTTLSSDNRYVSFSVYGESGGRRLVQGTLHYEPGPSSARLTVAELVYPGGSIARQVLAGGSQRQSLPMYFPSGFDLGVARQCAAHVLAAYDQYNQWVAQGCPHQEDFDWTPPSGNYSYGAPLWADIVVATTHNREPFGFVAWDASGDTFVAFRGTTTAKDWYANAQILQVNYPLVPQFGNVHVGFSSTYQTISPSLRAQIAQLPGITNLYFTGHSLGAALSTVAVPDIVQNTKNGKAAPNRVQYNFASPRVGDPGFAQQMNEASGATTFRIVNTADTVPTVPPAEISVPLILKLYYEHVGVPVLFTAEYGSITGNHSMANYQYAIENPDQPQGPT